jgi:hypothetical protein
MPWGRNGWGQKHQTRASVRFAGMWSCYTCGYHSPPYHQYCDRCSAPYGKSGHKNRHGEQGKQQQRTGGEGHQPTGRHRQQGGREQRRADGGAQARRRDDTTYIQAVVNGKPTPATEKAAGGGDDEQAILSQQLRSALADAEAVEKVLKTLVDPPEALQAVARDLRAKAEALRLARQHAKDPDQVAKEKAAKLETKSKQLAACKGRLAQAQSDCKFHAEKLDKAQAAVDREADLLERLAAEIKILHRDLGEIPHARDDEEEPEGDDTGPPRPSTAAGKEHLRGTAMDLDDPHQLGLAALLAGQPVGGLAEGGRAAAALDRAASAERRSRSPKQTRVAEAAAAIEAKKASA